MRWNNSKMYLLAACIVMYLFVLIFVFIRSSIEVGEERVWLAPYLVVVPLILAASIIWAAGTFVWWLRLVFGILTLVIAPILLVQTALLADRVYENPERFSLLLPAIIKAENLYLSVYSVEADRYVRHEDKARRWREIREERK